MGGTYSEIRTEKGIYQGINIQQSITEQLKKNNAMKMQSYKGKAVKPL